MGSLPYGRYLPCSLSWTNDLMVIRVRPTLTRSTTGVLYIPVDSPPLNVLPLGLPIGRIFSPGVSKSESGEAHLSSIEHGRNTLARYPNDLRSPWPLCVRALIIGCLPRGVLLPVGV